MISAVQALEQGWLSFHRGDIAHAEQFAHYVTTFHADCAEGWHLRGLIHHFRGDEAAALPSYERACELDPELIGPLNNLGVLYSSLGRHDLALTVLAKLLQAKPDDPIAQANFANALAATGSVDEAEAHYRTALAGQPDLFDALVNFGALLINRQRSQEAIDLLERAHCLQPQSIHAHNNLGLAHLNLEHDDKAAFHLAEALKLDPNSYEALTNLGNLSTKRKDHARAVQCLLQARELRPLDPKVHNNLGLALHDRGDSLEAIHSFRRALELQPDFVAAHANYGNALSDLCRFAEAETRLREALRLDPNHAAAHNVLGVVQFHYGDDDACQRSFEEALRHDPSLDRVRLNRAFLRLRQGDFTRGFPEYELRLKLEAAKDPPCPAPCWDGGDLNGRTILVRSEQGRGDILQYIRYLPRVRAKGGRVLFELPHDLHPMVTCSTGFDELLVMGAPLPPVDVQVAMMSLPHVLGSIEAPVPYLFADPNLAQSWGRELESIKGFKIGIAWQGDPAYRFDPPRSIPLKYFEALAQVPGVQLISLQKHVGLDQIAANRSRVPVIDFGDRLDGASGAFMDTAAIMANVDLVITSDTAAAHLAGALGVPTWAAISFAADWRWFLKRDDSPWYPSMRLFRQSEPGAWAEVFARLSEAVRLEMSHPPASASETVPDRNRGPAFFVPTSPGELLDKFCILQIKAERLTDPTQVQNVRTEIHLLAKQCDGLLAESQNLNGFVEQLKKVNETLWQVEEDLRSCERAKDFGPRFVELARSVYKNNDRRAALKQKINLSLGSTLTEEKNYGLPIDV
jgi:Flp pilus assembly protein TadD